MFAGHFAVAYAAKRLAPEVSLGTLFFAALFLDLLWPLLVLAGIEAVSLAPADAAFPLAFDFYPWSHSLAMAFVWAVIVARIHWATRRAGRAALLLFALVLSHWLLDFVTHLPDLPFRPGSPARYGLGLWNLPVVSLAVELLLLAGGAWLYLAATRPEGRTKLAAWALIAFLAVIQVANTFGPAPPRAEYAARAALAMWLLVWWAWWSDRKT